MSEISWTIIYLTKLQQQYAHNDDNYLRIGELLEYYRLGTKGKGLTLDKVGRWKE